MPGTTVVNLKNRLAVCCALFPIYPIGTYSFADQLPVFVISIVFDSSLIIMRLRLRHAKICKPVLLHRQLLLPSIVNHNHRHLVIRADKLWNSLFLFLLNTPVTKTRNDIPVSGLPFLRSSLYCTFSQPESHQKTASQTPPSRPSHHPTAQSEADPRSRFLSSEIEVKLQHKARSRHNILISMLLIWPVIPRKIHLHQLEALLNLSLPHSFHHPHSIRLPAKILRVKRCM